MCWGREHACNKLWVGVLQSVKDMPVLQDGPPPGGFPSIRYARRLPSTGPTGFTIFAFATAIMAYGFYRVLCPELRCLQKVAPRLAIRG